MTSISLHTITNLETPLRCFQTITKRFRNFLSKSMSLLNSSCLPNQDIDAIIAWYKKMSFVLDPIWTVISIRYARHTQYLSKSLENIMFKTLSDMFHKNIFFFFYDIIFEDQNPFWFIVRKRTIFLLSPILNDTNINTASIEN